ncbi:hypothetical protein H0X09_00400 [Candidatus Saccharibacteria bacterium]|nr:hypothetical protein [Candidatus Saccharibacteria bacterium]
MPVEDVLEILAGDRLPFHRATSHHLSGIHPFFAESGLIDSRTHKKALGIPYGYCGRERSGGLFDFDEYSLYQAGLLHNPNVKVFGEIDHRKSTGVKCMIFRGAAMGYNHLVTDRKGEYTPLAEAIPGSKVLKFGEDTNLFISPVDKSMDTITQRDLIASMVITAMGGDRKNLNIRETSLLWEAIKAAHEHFGMGSGGVATLPVVVEKLFNPTQDMADAMSRPPKYLKELGYDMALGLRRLTETDLKGMFHKETTTGLFEDTPLLVMNCEGVTGEAAVIMITLINFFTQSQWGRADARYRFHKVIHDESWDLAAYPGFVESVRRAFKLGRTWGVANWIVAHHMSNLYRSGKDEAIKDLVADSDTTISYKQHAPELVHSAEELEFNETEVARITELEPGRAIYKIGNQPGIEVEQQVWPEERPLVETSHLMHGKTELAKAS